MENGDHAAWMGGKTNKIAGTKRGSNLLSKQRLVWSENIAVHPLLTIRKSELRHVISIVSIFKCCVMKHHYVISKISSVFHSQSPINPVSFSPYATLLLALLARIRTAALLYYLNTPLYWQRWRLLSVFLGSTFHQDVA